MKIKQEHYEHMKQAIASIPSDMIEVHKHDLQNDSRVKDWEMRFRWDLAYGAKLSEWISRTLYSYLNDTHIDTGLRAIVKELDLA